MSLRKFDELYLMQYDWVIAKSLATALGDYKRKYLGEAAQREGATNQKWVAILTRDEIASIRASSRVLSHPKMRKIFSEKPAKTHSGRLRPTEALRMAQSWLMSHWT